MTQQSNEQSNEKLVLTSRVWNNLSYETLLNLDTTDLKFIERLVIKVDEPLNRSISADESTVPPSKTIIREMRIKDLKEKASKDDIWLRLPVLANLTGYKENTLRQHIRNWGVTTERHNICNALLISAQSFCSAYFNFSKKDRNSSTVTQDKIAIQSDTNYKSDLGLQDAVFQFHG